MGKSIRIDSNRFAKPNRFAPLNRMDNNIDSVYDGESHGHDAYGHAHSRCVARDSCIYL